MGGIKYAILIETKNSIFKLSESLYTPKIAYANYQKVSRHYNSIIAPCKFQFV